MPGSWTQTIPATYSSQVLTVLLWYNEPNVHVHGWLVNVCQVWSNHCLLTCEGTTLCWTLSTVSLGADILRMVSACTNEHSFTFPVVVPLDVECIEKVVIAVFRHFYGTCSGLEYADDLITDHTDTHNHTIDTCTTLCCTTSVSLCSFQFNDKRQQVHWTFPHTELVQTLHTQRRHTQLTTTKITATVSVLNTPKY